MNGRVSFFRFAIAALLFLSWVPAACAELLPTLSRRQLLIHSSHILVAEPLETPEEIAAGTQAWVPAPFAYRVLEVLKNDGRRISVGDLVNVEGTTNYRLGDLFVDPRKPRQVPRIEKALLFLAEVQRGEPVKSELRLVRSGIRGRTEEGVLLIPFQQSNPGPYFLSLRFPKKSGETWEDFKTQVRADIPLIAEVLALQEIEPASRRNQAIFKWIDKHRNDFAGSLSVFHSSSEKAGFASLESTVFTWIVESGIPEDGWKALVLRAEIFSAESGLSGWGGPERSSLSFATPRGRELLFEVVVDEMETATRRQIALHHLTYSCTPGVPKKTAPKLQAISKKEQSRFLEGLKPLLKSGNEKFRLATVNAIFRVSCPFQNVMDEFTSQSAVPALAEAYETEGPGRVRNALADTLFKLNAETYARLSGNPPNQLILLTMAAMNRNYGWEKINVHINTKGTALIGADKLPVTLHRIDAIGDIVEKRIIIGTMQWYALSGRAGELKIPSSELGEGTWRITVQSNPRNGSLRCRSEPTLVDLKRDVSRDE